jgi:hypothetical protein
MWFFKQLVELYWLGRLFGFFGARSAIRAWIFTLSLAFFFLFIGIIYISYMVNMYEHNKRTETTYTFPTRASDTSMHHGLPAGIGGKEGLRIVCKNFPDDEICKKVNSH